MAKLTLSFKGHTLKVHGIETEHAMIGRDPACDIFIDSLALSPRHVEISREGARYKLRSLDDQYPTFINDQQVSVKELNDGDVISIGKHTLKFEQDTAESEGEHFERAREGDDLDLTIPHSRKNQTTATDFEFSHARKQDAATGTELELTRPLEDLRRLTEPMPEGLEPTRPITEAKSSVADLEATQPLSESKARARLKVLDGKHAGRTILLESSMTRLGKGAHAIVISKRDDGYYVSQLASGNTLKLEGKAIGDEARRLESGDVFEIGSTRMEFSIG